MSYNPYNESNNPDLDTWKEHPNNLIKKQNGLMEMSIDLQDAKIMGTDESVEQLDQISSSYQLRFNKDNYLANAYEICLNDTYKMKC